MIVTELLVMVTVMASSAHDTAMGFPETRDCLSTGQEANGTNTCSLKNNEQQLSLRLMVKEKHNFKVVWFLVLV